MAVDANGEWVATPGGNIDAEMASKTETWTDPTTGVTYKDTRLYPDGTRRVNGNVGKGIDQARTFTINPDGQRVAQAGGDNAAEFHPLKSLTGLVRGTTDDLGLTTPAPPDLSKGPDAEALRGFAGNLVDEYKQRQPGTAPMLDQTAANQARAEQTSALDRFKGVADGTEQTAANALLTKGTDIAAKNAMGTAAAYSAGNPAMALRAGLGVAGDIGNKAAADAAMLKANEVAAARAALQTGAAGIRGQDINAAAANQGAQLTQQQIDAQKWSSLRAAAAASLAGPMAASAGNAQIQAQNAAGNQVAAGSLINTASQFFKPTPGATKDDEPFVPYWKREGA